MIFYCCVNLSVLNRVFRILLLDFNLFFKCSCYGIFFCCQIELPKHKSNFILIIISTDFFIYLNILCETLVLIIIFIETLGEGNILYSVLQLKCLS